MSERDIFTAAREMADPAARSAYLDRACDGDAGMRARVEALLRAHDQPDSLLDHPAVSRPEPGQGPTQAFSAPDAGRESREPAEEEVPLGFLESPTRPDAMGRIGHYEVLQVLGQGGFGIVFRAFDDVLHRVVAVKVLSPQMAATSPARKRFLREARSSAQVRHENVVQVHEVGEQPLPYIAMEFIPGETLQQRLDRVGPVEPAEVVRVGRQVAEGLAAAHACDLIHRDIKPGNVLLEGGAQRVKLTDFGLARAADDASISQSGLIAGTPMYMAPEQAKGEKLDQRADLFSLGSVLYQMAAGRPPFRANGTVAVLKRVAEDTPRPIREIIPETPQWLCDIIAKLHAKKPDDRYQSAREVADVLADCEAQLKANAKLKDYSRIPRSKPQRSGRRKWVAVAVAVLLLAVVALAVTELAGVTHLFRGQLATIDAIKPGPEPTPPYADGWVQLFNGTDLTGWKTHPDQPGDWRVEDGVLIGRGPRNSHLFSDRGDYGDFHLRVEAKLDPGGNSGVCFRSGFELISVGADPGLRLPPGFEADINDAPNQTAKTGTLWRVGHGAGTLVLVKEALVPPDTWFQLEVIAIGPRITVKVNGRTTADWWDDRTDHRTGHVALQVNWPVSTIVRFRKIEIKELPPSSPATMTPPPAVAPFTDADVQRIAALPAEQQVEEVRKELMRRNPGFDGKLEHKIEDGVVTEFRIVTDQVTDIAPIRVFNALRGLVCTGTDTDKPNGGLLADLTPLEGMNLAGLRHLRLAHTKVSDAGMVYFKDCKGLINLELKDTKVTDRGLAHFKNCKDLAVLDLTFLNVTDAGLDYFKDCKDLRYLHLPFTKVTDVGLAQFKHCKNLVSLGLDGTRVSDVGLAHFNDCKSLTGLYLQSTQVSDAGLIHFKHCKNLSSLDVSYTGVGDSGLANVQGMPLRELKLQRTGVTDLTPLQGMPLEEIRLTPKNITRGLDILRDMKSLKTIGVDWNQAWPAAEFWERYDKGEFTK